MPISAYVLRCEASAQPSLLARLRALPGLEIGTVTDQGVPVAAESATTRDAAALGEHLQTLPGVRSAVLVYHHFEDVADDETAQPLESDRGAGMECWRTPTHELRDEAGSRSEVAPR